MEEQRSYYIGQSRISGAGRALFASRDIPAGEVAFACSRPLVTALDAPALEDTCAHCFKRATRWSVDNHAADDHTGDAQSQASAVKACTGCKTLHYCSRKCQAQSWKRGHKAWCTLLGRLRPKGVLPNAARAALDMLLLVPAHGWWHAESPFHGMKSHHNDIIKAGGERAEQLFVLSTGVHEYSATKVGLDVVQQLIALVMTNSLSLYTPDFGSLGIALDPAAASANHSCMPNCAVVYDGAKLQYRSVRDIKKDDEITINYVDGTDPLWRRRKLLKERYYFECQCSKCLADEKTEVEDKEEREIQEYGFAALAKVGKVQYGDTLPQLRRALSLCLGRGEWPPARQPLPMLWYETFMSLLRLEHWVAAFRVALKIYFDIYPCLYTITHHPNRVAFNATLASLAYQLASLSGDAEVVSLAAGPPDLFWATVVVGLMTEVVDNVARSHGTSSSFAIAMRAKLQQTVTDMTRGGAQGLAQARQRQQLDRAWARLRDIGASAEGEIVNSR